MSRQAALRTRRALELYRGAVERWLGAAVGLDDAIRRAEALRLRSGAAIVHEAMLADAVDAIETGLAVRAAGREPGPPGSTKAAALAAAALAVGEATEPAPPRESPRPRTLALYARLRGQWRDEKADPEASIRWAEIVARRRSERGPSEELLLELVRTVRRGLESSASIAPASGARQQRTEDLLAADRAAGPPRSVLIEFPDLDAERSDDGILPSVQTWSRYARAATEWRGVSYIHRDPVSWADAMRRSMRRTRTTEALLELASSTLDRVETELAARLRRGDTGAQPPELLATGDRAAGLPAPEGHRRAGGCRR